MLTSGGLGMMRSRIKTHSMARKRKRKKRREEIKKKKKTKNSAIRNNLTPTSWAALILQSSLSLLSITYIPI